MIDRFARLLKVPMSIEQWERLPKHPAYKYEYFDGCAAISPGHRCHGATLALDRFVPDAATDDGVSVRPIEGDDWAALTEPLASAMATIPPLDMLIGDECDRAAARLLRYARFGGEGPLVPGASHVSVDRERGPIGAAIVTLVKPWRQRLLDRAANVVPEPTLAWIFVTPWEHRRGVGSAMLAASVAALRANGYATLFSNFAAGNDASMRFHWRNGFALEPDPIGRAIRSRAAPDPIAKEVER